MPPRGRVVKTRAHDTKSASEAYLAHTWTYPGHFGRGSTAAEAVSNLRGHAGGDFLRTHGYVVFRVHPETTVNHDGQLLWPLPHKPVLVENKLKHDADLSEFEAVSKAPVGGRGPTKAEADAVAKLIGHPPLNAPKVRK